MRQERQQPVGSTKVGSFYRYSDTSQYVKFIPSNSRMSAGDVLDYLVYIMHTLSVRSFSTIINAGKMTRLFGSQYQVKFLVLSDIDKLASLNEKATAAATTATAASAPAVPM